MFNLNTVQSEAASHLTGPMMVLAGPGSGKTAVITARAATLGQPLLVITYSKAAATEMERRYALYTPTGSVTFGTFHSIFFRMLRREKNIDVSQILKETERRYAIRAFLESMQYSPDEEMLSNVISEMSLMRNELMDIKYYYPTSMGKDDFNLLCESYETYKHDKNKLDFDDMLCLAYQMLKENPRVLEFWQQAYPYIMIDEFQDINCVQYEAVKLLAAQSQNIFVVGDDDQSIYRFRGSRPEFLLNFPKDFSDTKQITLETNYRSTENIIAFSNKIIMQNTLRYDKTIKGTGKQGTDPQILTTEDQNAEAVQIAEIIRDMWAKGADLNEIAVIFRLNIQARAFTDAFLNMNIPYKTRDEIPNIYEHWIAQDIFAYLRAAHKLKNGQLDGYCADAARIINKPFRFISKAFLQQAKKQNKNIFKIYKYDKTLHLATKSNIEELEEFLLYLTRMETSEAIRYIRQNIGYNVHIISHCEYRKLKPAGLMEIADELQTAAKPFKIPQDFITHAEATAEAARQNALHGEQDTPCCTLATLHSAKGLEFEKVFIAGAVEDVLPHARSQTEPEIEEERRLFYVGITRAKNELYISVIKNRYEKPAKRTRFLQ